MQCTYGKDHDISVRYVSKYSECHAYAKPQDVDVLTKPLAVFYGGSLA